MSVRTVTAKMKSGAVRVIKDTLDTAVGNVNSAVRKATWVSPYSNATTVYEQLPTAKTRVLNTPTLRAVL